MKKKAFIMMLFICLLVFPFSIKAFCYSKDKIKFQKLAENIDYTYVFDENTKTFNIIFTNLQTSLSLNEVVYPDQETTLTGFIPGNSYNFVVKTNDSSCYDETIKTIYVNLPIYNANYSDPLCQGLHDYDICQKWGKYISNRSEFEKQVQKINSSTKEDNSEEETQKEYKGIFDYLANIFVNSYYVVLPIIIVICLFGIYRLNKKEKLF